MHPFRRGLAYLLVPIGIKRRTDLTILLRYKWHPFFILSCLKKSYSQLGQDVFVAGELKLWKKSNAPHFFVEFGAADGIELSNTYLLESLFNWSGVLAEPAKSWQVSLNNNRKCIIDHRCVYGVTGKTLVFKETIDAVYSTISEYQSIDSHSVDRQYGKEYTVDTVSLVDMLVECSAPKKIDYLSIDTEGSEYEILAAFDFDQYSFKIITVEHNYTEQREKISDLLSSHGYKRILPDVSLWDDWYVYAQSR